DVAAADDDGADVGGGGGEDRGLQGQVVGGARGAQAVQGHGDQVGPGAGDDLAGVGPAQAGVTVAGGGLEKSLRGEVAAGLAAPAGGVVGPPRLLQEGGARAGLRAPCV